ncbi:MAG: outer-membrane lipoprotein carrier protein LolA [Chitinispirillaceae bacterium]|nr:outer-membrane lipoprotein carrier protein LolA [Chitinispirillaceae bacterium]
MKLKYFFLIILTVGLYLCKADSKNEICKKIMENYVKNLNMESDFDQSIYWSVREKTTKNKGKIVLSSGNKFRVELTNEKWISNGNICWYYNSKSNQVLIRNLKDFDQTLLPSYILSNYLSSCNFVEKRRDKGILTLAYNKDSTENLPYKSIVLTMDNKSGTILSLFFIDENDNEHTYVFKKTTLNKKISPQSFNFEVPSDAEIIDYRK